MGRRYLEQSRARVQRDRDRHDAGCQRHRQHSFRRGRIIHLVNSAGDWSQFARRSAGRDRRWQRKPVRRRRGHESRAGILLAAHGRHRRRAAVTPPPTSYSARAGTSSPTKAPAARRRTKRSTDALSIMVDASNSLYISDQASNRILAYPLPYNPPGASKVPPPSGALDVRPASLRFDATAIGESRTGEVTLENAGTTQIAIGTLEHGRRFRSQPELRRDPAARPKLHGARDI